jgi:hypothetical protein
MAAWSTAALLLLMHGPGALAGRVLVTATVNSALHDLNGILDIGNPPGVENQDVVIINPPSMFITAYAPFAKTYAHQPLPRTLRTLVPGCASFDVERSDEKTLIIQSKASNIFSCGDLGPVHPLYALRFSNVSVGELEFRKGQRFERGGLVVEILELDAEKMPSRIACRFNASLDSPTFHWLQFNCQTLSFEPFAVPPVGQRDTVIGAVPPGS